MKSQPAPNWALDMAKIPFNPMEERAAFAATAGPCSALPSSAQPSPPLRPMNIAERPLQVPPGVALLDAQFDLIDAREKAERMAALKAATAQTAAFEKFMKQAAEWDRLFAEWSKRL